jgi:tripartite-type tricarboxylate transporter receptor subunit TctC
MSRRQFLVFASLLSIASRSTAAVTRRPYTAETIRIIVPLAPGGGADLIARKLSIALSDNLAVSSVIVENRPGASTQIGSRMVATSKPDGSVLLFTTTNHVINPALYHSLPYDTERDFVPIAMIASSPSLLVVNPKLGAKSVADFVALAKQSPGKLTFSSSATGGANHLSGEMFKKAAGIDIYHVPYSGASQAIAGVLGSHVSAAFVTPSSVVPFLKSGELIALATTGPQRLESLPDVPTMYEVLHGAGFDALVWFGLYAPHGLPPETRQTLEDIVKAWLASGDVKAFFNSEGLTAGNLYGAALESYVTSEIKKWSKAATDAKVEKQ